MVKIGQIRLNFKVIQEEGLTILLESCGGNDSTEWDGLAPDLACRTGATIVSYDRAGFGKSDFIEALGLEYLDNHPLTGKHPYAATPPEKLSKQQRALVRMAGEGLRPKAYMMQHASIPRGIPVWIITSGKHFLPNPEEQRAWRQSHEKMAASIEGANLVVAEKSGHMIPWAQPEIIIDAVTEIIRVME